MGMDNEELRTFAEGTTGNGENCTSDANEVVKEVKEENPNEEIDHVCKLCRKHFKLTKHHEDWYRNHNLNIPTHCPSCIAMYKKDAAKMRAKTEEPATEE